MNTRKTFLYAGLIVLSAGFVACQDKIIEITPVTNNAAEDFYNDERQFDQGVMAVYNDLLGLPTAANWALSDVRSDDTFKDNAVAQRDGVEIGLFTVSSQTSTLQGLWDRLYNMVYRANILLEKSEPFPEFARKAQFRAEARFLRALAFFNLVRYWGAVPYVDKVLTIQEAKTNPRLPREQVYANIVADLQYAATTLPESYSAADVGRATRWAAKALLGKVYLTMAGYPLKQADKLPLAQKELADVIAQEGRGFSLAANYADQYKTVNDNKYHVFEIQYIAGGFGLGNPLPGEQPTSLPKAWADYAPTGFGFAPSRDLINSFSKADKRLMATVDTTWTENNVVTRKDVFTKFVDKTNKEAKSRSDWPNNFPIIEYADVLLMYAEVLNEQVADGAAPPADAVAKLNRIRARAGVPALSPATKQEFRLAMERERRWEFAGTGARWHDLVRTGRAVEVMNNYIKTSGQPVVRPISENDLLYPVPFKEININPGFWQQNPGYN